MKTYFHSKRNGDFHIVRGFIRDMMQKLESDEFCYYSWLPNAPHCICDIQNLKKVASARASDRHRSYQIIDGNRYVCVHPAAWVKVNCNDTTYHKLYAGFKVGYQEMGISLASEEDLLPWIDFSAYRVAAIKAQLNTRAGRMPIFVATNMPLSGQSQKSDMTSYVNEMITRHQDLDFYVSNEVETSAPNLFCINTIVPGFNLNECSYLSEQAPIIVGRCSGPQTYAFTKNNLMNPKKAFVCFNSAECVARWYEPRKSKVFWSNDYTIENMVSVTEKALAEFGK